LALIRTGIVIHINIRIVLFLSLLDANAARWSPNIT
jgi:hypothetical protein